MRFEDVEIGMRVRSISSFGGSHLLVNATGTVYAIEQFNIGVRFDNPFKDGHTLYGACEKGHGRWGFAEELEPIDDEDTIESIEFSFDELMKF